MILRPREIRPFARRLTGGDGDRDAPSYGWEKTTPWKQTGEVGEAVELPNLHCLPLPRNPDSLSVSCAP